MLWRDLVYAAAACLMTICMVGLNMHIWLLGRPTTSSVFCLRSFLPTDLISETFQPVASLEGGTRGADRPGWHPPGGWHPKEKNVGILQRIAEKRARTGKKGVGWHPRGGDTPVKAIKSDKAMSKKRSSGSAKKKSGVIPQNWRLKKGRQIFREKIEGWHPQLPPRVSPTLVTPLLPAAFRHKYIRCCVLRLALKFHSDIGFNYRPQSHLKRSDLQTE